MWLGKELFHFILWQVNKLLMTSEKNNVTFEAISTEKLAPCEITKIFPDQQGWNVKGSNAFTEHLFLFWISLNCLPEYILSTCLREVKGLRGPGD